METGSSEIGFIESYHWLTSPRQNWKQGELLAAATAAVLRNTGWPIGVVLSPTEVAPHPTESGIEAKIGEFQSGRFDFWSFNEDGKYYFLRKFEEETVKLSGITPAPPEYVIWWDVRVWRIAEAFMHSASLYGSLGVPVDSEYNISIGHQGLRGREFYSSRPMTYLTRGGKFSRIQSVLWEGTVTQDLVTGGLRGLVHEVSSQLFTAFDFANVHEGSFDDALNRFLNSRL